MRVLGEIPASEYIQAVTELTNDFTAEKYIDFLKKYGGEYPCNRFRLQKNCLRCPLLMYSASGDLVICAGYVYNDKQMYNFVRKTYDARCGEMLLAFVKLLTMIGEGGS